jgi:hypothetical protein
MLLVAKVFGTKATEVAMHILKKLQEETVEETTVAGLLE